MSGNCSSSPGECEERSRASRLIVTPVYSIIVQRISPQNILSCRPHIYSGNVLPKRDNGSPVVIRSGIFEFNGRKEMNHDLPYH